MTPLLQRLASRSLLLVCLLGQMAVAQSPPDSDRSVAEPGSDHFELVSLAEGVWAAVHREGGMAISNAGIVNLGDRTLVFDAFLTAEAAADLRAVAERVTGRPAALVVNSHPHNDHVRGNQVVAHEAVIVSSAATRAIMREAEPAAVAAEREWVPGRLADAEAALASAPPEAQPELRLWRDYYRALLRSHEGLQTTPPTMTFEGTLTLHGSQRTAELRTMGRGHTRDDVVLYLPDDRIVFAGDLLFVDHHPWLGDAAPRAWTETLRAMHAWGVEAFVPGHGPVSPPAALLTLADYLDTLDQLVGEHTAAGATADEVAALTVPEAYAGWRLKAFFPMNLRTLHAAHTAAQTRE